MTTRALLLLGMTALPLVPRVASAATTVTVAVMPFRDLSDAKTQVGEAIRETVTTDLREVPGLQVIERANLDKILIEQKLQANRADLDPLSTVKVGKLLGATLVVTGAYQRTKTSVRLTARFVKVETGEIVGAAKVDGVPTDFLQLQDQVTSELLRSAGMAQKHVQRFIKRPRPKLKSLRPIELYGEAVMAENDDNRHALLQAAVAEDATFVYAVKDLEALETRLRLYQKKADTEQQRAADEASAALATEKDPAKIAELQSRLLQWLVTTRRYHRLVREARVIMEHGVAIPQGNLRTDELAGFYLVQAESQLKQHDAALRDGEVFLQKWNKSLYFGAVKGMMDGIINNKRRAEDGQKKAADELAKLESDRRWDLCNVASIYHHNHRFAEAQRLFRACLEVGTDQRPRTLKQLIWIDVEMGDWAAARRDMAVLEKESPVDFRDVKSFEQMLPTDG